MAFPCELSAPYSHLPNALGCMVVHVAHLGNCAVFSSQPLANCFIFSESTGKCSRLLVKGPWIRLSKLSPQFAHALCKYSATWLGLAGGWLDEPRGHFGSFSCESHVRLHNKLLKFNSRLTSSGSSRRHSLWERRVKGTTAPARLRAALFENARQGSF